MKKKNKIFTSIVLVVFVLLFTVSAFFALPMKASAATNTSGEYILSGSYKVDNFDYTGYPSCFQIKISSEYFSEDTSTSVLYNGKVLNWTYFNFDIEGTGTYKCKHVSFNLTRNGSEYYTRDLSGTTGSGRIAKGILSDGDYVLTYVGKYTSSNVTRKYTFTYNFTVDTTNPSNSLKAGGSSIANASYTNKYITYSYSDANPDRLYYLSPSSSSFTYTTSTSKTVSATSSNNGWWYFYAKDDGGNYSSTVRVYLDTVAPVGTVMNSNGSTLGSGSYSRYPIKYSASDTGGVSYLQVLAPNSDSWTTYSSGTYLSSYYGWYYFRAVDKAGNVSSTTSVCYDPVLPTVTIYGGEDKVSSGGITNAEYVKFVPYDAHSGVAYCYVQMPNTSYYTSYSIGTELTEEGTYSFYCTDRCGNKSDYYAVTLDKSVPSAQLYADGEKITSKSYTNAECVYFISDGTECYVQKPGSDGYEQYLSGTELFRSGRYLFYAIDDAGNSTGIYTVVIDRTEKSVSLSNISDGNTNGDVTVVWTDGDSAIYAPIISVTVNGVSVCNGDTVHTIATGEYEVIVTDAAGNVWSTSFTSTKKNILTDTLVREFYEVKNADGTPISYADYDNALNYARKIENEYVTVGIWSGSSWDGGIAMDSKDSVNATNGTYYIYKKSGVPSERVAYFTADRLNEVIDEYARQRIEKCYYWQKIPENKAEGESFYVDGIIDSSVILGDNIIAYLDGEVIIGNIIEVEGEHIVTVKDNFGNSCDYPITVVRSAPQIMYSAGGGNNIADTSMIYHFKDEIALTVNDGLDCMAMLYVLDDKEKMIGVVGVGEWLNISESGTYTIVSVNHNGESEPLKIIISRKSPTVNFSDNVEEKRLDIEITESDDIYSHIQEIEILKSTDNGQTWESLSEDDYGKEISLSKLNYSFKSSGIYKVVVTDEFRTGIDAIVAQYSYGQKAPSGILSGVENGGYTNGTVTFRWDDEAVVSVTKDGEIVEYRSRSDLRADGHYVITMENLDGVKTIYSFTIDRQAPIIKLNGVEEGKTTNNDVSLTHTDKAELYKDGELVGEYISDTPITDDGEYKIVVTDLSGNVTKTTFTIDKTPPALTLKGVENGGVTTGSVTLSDIDKKATVKVYLDGEEIDFSIDEELKAVGTYKIIVSDEYGNTDEYTFTIEQGSNVGIFILLGVIVLMAIGGGVFVLIKKKNRI